MNFHLLNNLPEKHAKNITWLSKIFMMVGFKKQCRTQLDQEKIRSSHSQKTEQIYQINRTIEQSLKGKGLYQ